MDPARSLESLAEQILSASKTVSSYLNTNGLPQPTFEPNAPLDFPSAPMDIMVARQTLLQATKRLHDLVTGPSEHLRWLSCGYTDLAALQWIHHFDIADAIPLDHYISYTEVATKTGVDEVQLRRILRHAMMSNLFCEPRAGFVAHSAESSVLVRDRGLKAWIGFTTNDCFPAGPKIVEATERWGASDEMNRSAFNVAFDTPLPMFGYWTQHPDRLARFAETMGTMLQTDAYNVRHMLEGFDWEGIGKGTVVDVGGSRGHASIAIAKKAPELTFIVEDLPETVAEAEASIPDDLKGRISFKSHDFFTPQVVKDADVYLLRMILHDFPDKQAIDVVKNLIPAFKDGARLVIMDGVMPEPNTIAKTQERFMRIMDIQLMLMMNARERGLDDWTKLFTAADPRLKVRNVITPLGSAMSVMEVVLEAISTT